MELRDYQKKYKEKLTEEYKIGPFHALVCIPTGGGKTAVAVSFLIDNVVPDGKKVLWIANSKFLIEQAYQTFHDMMENSDKENFIKQSIRIYSDNATVGIGKIDDIRIDHKFVFATWQSLSINPQWKEKIGDNVVIIVDEAHHTMAKTYFNLITENGYSAEKTVIGLTATPLRNEYYENQDLLKFYNKGDLHCGKSMSDLINQGFLVRPRFFNGSYELNDSDEGLDSVDKLNNYIWNDDNYNNAILDEYKKHSRYGKPYGKTVIFAINQDHAKKLYDIFEKEYEKKHEKDKVHLVISDMPDKSEFKSFKDSETDDNIMINVNMLSEGVDIPDIKTIFLTKVMQSRIAVTQIIGRALRVPAENINNKTEAVIVNFAVPNIGTKVLMVLPELAFTDYIYATEEEKSVKAMSRLKYEVEDKIREHKAVALNDAFYAGFYDIYTVESGVKSEERVDQIPVTYKDYKNIEELKDSIKGTKKKINKKFKLFFREDTELLINKAENGEIEIGELNPFGDFDGIKGIIDYIEEIKIINCDPKQLITETDGKICELYYKLINNGFNIVNVSIIKEMKLSGFKRLVRNEMHRKNMGRKSNNE